jgi:hypothetical protein
MFFFPTLFPISFFVAQPYCFGNSSNFVCD